MEFLASKDVAGLLAVRVAVPPPVAPRKTIESPDQSPS